MRDGDSESGFQSLLSPYSARASHDPLGAYARGDGGEAAHLIPRGTSLTSAGPLSKSPLVPPKLKKRLEQLYPGRNRAS